MKEWLVECPMFAPRPVVFMDDRAHHVHDLCAAFRGGERYTGEILSRTTIVLLESPGLDTEIFVADTLLKYPEVQIVAGPFDVPLGKRLAEYEAASLRGHTLEGTSDLDRFMAAHLPLTVGKLSRRFLDLPSDVVLKEPSLVRLLDRLIRPGGLMISDIEMTTLRFTSGSDDNLLLGVHAASTASRMQGERAEITQEPARLVVVSNRTKYSTRPDKVLREHGIDVEWHDILRKTDDMEESVQKAGEVVRERFPWSLEMRSPIDNRVVHIPVGLPDQIAIDAALDVVIWPIKEEAFRISGRALEEPGTLKARTGRAEALLLLSKAHLSMKQEPVPTDAIDEKIEGVGERQTAALAINGIQDALGEMGRELIPHCRNRSYRFAETAKVGIVHGA